MKESFVSISQSMEDEEDGAKIEWVIKEKTRFSEVQLGVTRIIVYVSTVMWALGATVTMIGLLKVTTVVRRIEDGIISRMSEKRSPYLRLIVTLTLFSVLEKKVIKWRRIASDESIPRLKPLIYLLFRPLDYFVYQKIPNLVRMLIVTKPSTINNEFFSIQIFWDLFPTQFLPWCILDPDSPAILCNRGTATVKGGKIFTKLEVLFERSVFWPCQSDLNFVLSTGDLGMNKPQYSFPVKSPLEVWWITGVSGRW